MTKRVISWLVILLLPIMIFAASGDKVSGLVVNEVTGEPLIGANVIIKGLNIGAATNEDGYFSFTFDVEEAFVLVVSYMGYKSKEVDCSPDRDLSNLEVRMTEDVFRGEEVVVTGIASATSREMAPVSVGTVKATELTELNAYSDIAQLINGKVSGARISTSSGNVGGGYRFDIRSGGGLNGNGQPVIYVDGIRIDNSEIEGRYAKGGQEISMMASLNPSEIENIEILKGPAAAATYGTDGSNGVVLITTKKGKLVKGGKGYSINYNYKTGTNMQSYKYTKDDMVSYKAANSVFQDGQFEGHNLSISGGNEQTRYFFTMGLHDEDGVMVNNSMERKNMRLNVDAIASEKLSVSGTISMNQSLLARPENDNNIYGWMGNTQLRPTPWGWLDSLSIAGAKESIDIKKMSGSFKATYTPIKNLTVHGSIGAEHSGLNSQAHYPPWGSYLYTNGSRQLYDRFNTQYTFTSHVGYKYTVVPGLTGTSKIGTQMFDQHLRSTFFSIDSLASDKIKNIMSANGDNFLTDYGEGFATFRSAGVFFDNNYNYQNKVMFGASIRRDFASSLSDKAAAIIYPQANIAVRLDNLGLTPAMFDMFKIRMAYGETGQLPGATAAIPLIWAAEVSGWGGGLTVENIGNNKLEPERIKELEVGLDFGFFNRVNVEATYAKMNAVNSIVGRELAPSTGLIVEALPDNLGEVEGNSFELGIDWLLINKKNFRLDVTSRNSWQNDKIKKMGEPVFPDDIQVFQEGFSRWTYYDEKVDSIWYDADGRFEDYRVSSLKKKLGNATPDYFGSLSFNMSLFKNINIYTLFDWKTDFKVYNFTKIYQTFFGNNVTYTNAGDLVDSLDALTDYDYSKKEYTNAVETYAKYDATFAGSRAAFIEDGDYFKIRELSVSYDASDLFNKYLKHTGIKRIVFAFTGNNLVTWTKYGGADPDVSSNGATVDPDETYIARNNDFLTMQHPKRIGFSIQLGL